VDCISKLAAKGKKIVLLSNSSRRKGNSMQKLDKMGFDRLPLQGHTLNMHTPAHTFTHTPAGRHTDMLTKTHTQTHTHTCEHTHTHAHPRNSHGRTRLHAYHTCTPIPTAPPHTCTHTRACKFTRTHIHSLSYTHSLSPLTMCAPSLSSSLSFTYKPKRTRTRTHTHTHATLSHTPS